MNAEVQEPLLSSKESYRNYPPQALRNAIDCKGNKSTAGKPSSQRKEGKEIEKNCSRCSIPAGRRLSKNGKHIKQETFVERRGGGKEIVECARALFCNHYYSWYSIRDNPAKGKS